MSGEDRRYLNGTRLSEVWAKVKSHVTSSLQGWDGRNTTTSGQHTSNISHVGTISYGTWHGSAIEAAYIGSSAKGQLLYGNGSNVMALLGIGTAGQFLKVVSGAPAWSDLPEADGTSGEETAGIVTTGEQSFAGLKTFMGSINIPSGSYYYKMGGYNILQLNGYGHTVFNYGRANDTNARCLYYAGARHEWYVGATEYMRLTSTMLQPKAGTNLGSNSYRWGTAYANYLNLAQSAVIGGDVIVTGGVAAGGIADLNLY